MMAASQSERGSDPRNAARARAGAQRMAAREYRHPLAVKPSIRGVKCLRKSGMEDHPRRVRITITRPVTGDGERAADMEADRRGRGLAAQWRRNSTGEPKTARPWHPVGPAAASGADELGLLSRVGAGDDLAHTLLV